MKNIHVIPTSQPSRLYYNGTSYKDANSTMAMDWYISSGHKPQNIYITSNEKPKAGDWSIYQNKIHKCIEDIIGDEFKKIILTTDQDLIKDGVQAIDDEFLEWFVKNPSCEEVEVNVFYHKLYIPVENLTQYKSQPKEMQFEHSSNINECCFYKIIIPKEEQKQHLIDMMRYDEELGLYEKPKQETLEEAIKREYEARKFNSDFPFDPQSFKLGAKWEAKRRYSEEEVFNLCRDFAIFVTHNDPSYKKQQEWFDKVKKK